jgi:hypothetical protein
MDKHPNVDRRKYPRVRTDSVVAIRRVEDGPKLAQGLDLGLGGIRFQCVGLELDLGETVEVTFNLGDDTSTVLGRIVRLTDLDPFTQEIGLAFLHVDPDTLDRFYEFGLAGDEIDFDR